MSISYRLYDPSGNITAVAYGKDSVSGRRAAAREILKAEPSCEQVGFISEAAGGEDVSLEMVGGEFCGNAVFAAALWYAEENDVFSGGRSSAVVRVTVSGSEILEVVLTKDGEDSFYGSYRFPRLIAREKLRGLDVFGFEGIKHAVIWDKAPAADAEALVRELCEEAGSKAFGLMFTDARTFEVKPLVFVREPETLYWENSCASGSAAIAHAAALRGIPFEAELRFPGGIITVSTDDGNNIVLKEKIKNIDRG